MSNHRFVLSFLAASATLAACSSGTSRAVGPVTTLASPTSVVTTTPPAPSTTVPAGQAGQTDQTVLSQLAVQQADVPTGYTVQLLQGGDQVSNQVTLDLCSASYPSEQLRTARRQVSVQDSQQQEVLSTEAVLYQGAAATAQAFAELRSAQAHCPATFAPGLVQGQPPTKTVFNPAPDSAWPAVPGVERLAFDATLSDQQGHTAHEIGVYLRRGRVLLGLYFAQLSGPQIAIAGQTSVATIVGAFAARLAKLSPSEVA